jgi:hypothetical protein
MTKKGPSSKLTLREREERQAASLRANLLRRKEQQRAREGKSKGTDKPSSTT